MNELQPDEDRRGTRPPPGAWTALLILLAAAALATAGVTIHVLLLPVAGLLLGVAVALLIARQIVIAVPTRIAVISGRSRELADGTRVGYRVVQRGRAFCLPFVERVDFLDARPHQFTGSVRRAYTQDRVPFDIRFQGALRLGSRPEEIESAVARFLGEPSSKLEDSAVHILEGHFRGVLTCLRADELRENHLVMVEGVFGVARGDLARLGLQLETLNAAPVESAS